MDLVGKKLEELNKAEKIASSISDIRKSAYDMLVKEIEKMVIMGPNTNPTFITNHDIHVFYYLFEIKGISKWDWPKFSIHKIVKSVFPDSVGDIWVCFGTGSRANKPSLDELIGIYTKIKLLYEELNAPGELKIKVISNLSHNNWY